MNHGEITAITLLLLHTWSADCVCSWFAAHEGTCSRCYALSQAEQNLPLIFEAFTNTIQEMETQK